MRNKAEIRAFCVEQVVRMRCMSDCSSEEIIREAKGLEDYIVGDANIPEFVNEASELMAVISDMKDALKQQVEKEYRFPAYDEVVGYSLKPNEA